MAGHPRKLRSGGAHASTRLGSPSTRQAGVQDSLPLEPASINLLRTVTAPRTHTRADRARIVDRLVEMHRRALGANLLGLAVQGSYAREEDREYSDLELIAFLKELPADEPRLDGEQIFDGMMVDLVWTTEDEYIASVKEVTDVWYIAGSDYLAPLVNSALIERINRVQPDDLQARCLEQAVRRWPALYEATTKVLNTVEREDAPDLGRLFFSVLDHVLVELAFLNATPYISNSSTLEEALRLPKQPASMPELAAVAVEGAYTDRERVAKVVVAVLSELEALLTAEGAMLDVQELTLPRIDAPEGQSGV